MNWLIVSATMLAAAVEWIEALTIVLAVGLFKGWRTAIVGTVAATIALAAIVFIFGYAATAYVNIVLVRAIVGFFLLLFGLKWLTKSIMRYAGLKALHDEAEEFAETAEYLETHRGQRMWGLDRVGFTTSFSGVFLEGLEVVFIVIALGGLNSLTAATVGAAIALVAVVVVGVIARHPLTRVPENTIKFVVGVMLTAFGTFFAGEGIGVKWWHEDVVILPLLGIYLAASVVLIMYLRRPAPSVERKQLGAERVVRAVGSELWSLLVGDGSIAIVAIAVLFGVGFQIAKLGSGAEPWPQPLFVAGVIAAVVIGIWGTAAKKRPAAPASVTVSANGGTDGELPAHKSTEQPVT
jgi:uncharacterized membrane protein